MLCIVKLRYNNLCYTQVQTNIFPDLVAARYVRLLVSTSLRWVGHDTKCFR